MYNVKPSAVVLPTDAEMFLGLEEWHDVRIDGVDRNGLSNDMATDCVSPASICTETFPDSIWYTES